MPRAKQTRRSERVGSSISGKNPPARSGDDELKGSLDIFIARGAKAIWVNLGVSFFLALLCFVFSQRRFVPLFWGELECLHRWLERVNEKTKCAVVIGDDGRV